MSLILLAVSVIFTLLVAFVGRAPVGPENSEVGFAALNAALHDQFGYNTVFYGISSVLGYLTILTALINCVSFLVILVKKKDLRMVRADLTATLGIYILLAVLYLVFEFVVINYRPVILEEGLEASFPSTHSMLAIAVMFSAAQQVRTGMKESGIRNILILLCVLTGVLTPVTRFFSGVHWFTDILGGVLYGLFLTSLFAPLRETIRAGQRRIIGERRPHADSKTGAPLL
jgi:undecaprenyl-diphosphatase